MYVPNEELCPIPVEHLGSILQGRDEGLLGVSELPQMQRVELAFFCYRRAHLRHLAVKIANTCDPVALRRVGGAAGEALYRATSQIFEERPHRKPISLAGRG